MHRPHSPRKLQRLFYPHCKMEPAWGDFAFAIDVSETCPLKKQSLAEYKSLFQVGVGDQLLELYGAEDAHMGSLFGLEYAEVFKSQSSAGHRSNGFPPSIAWVTASLGDWTGSRYNIYRCLSSQPIIAQATCAEHSFLP